MTWFIPGTIISASREDAQNISFQFQALFLGGNIPLSQVSAISGLEAYRIQNWVKRGFLSPPVSKKYSINQLCRILTIHMLCGALSMDQILSLLKYINGKLDDESDDIISDSALYFIFVEAMGKMTIAKEPIDKHFFLQNYTQQLSQYPDDAKNRIAQVLSIMADAWIATLHKTRAEESIAAII